MSLLKKISTTAGVVLAAGTLVATEAAATEGYFQNGLGTRHKGMAGAGVADGQDATAITLNPAGLVRAGRQFNGAISVFMPFRSYTAAGPGVAPPTPAAVPGTQKSDREFFVVPNIAYSHPISDTTTFGFSISGNGGMNSTYKAIGPFGGGTTGIDLIQMNITGGIGTKLGEFVSVGIAPVFTMQRFKAKGLSGFALGSSNAAALTNRGYDYAFGIGVRVGAEVAVADNLRVGASYQSKTVSSRLKKYAGLFAQRGGFDVPSNFQIGVSYDATPSLTLNIDAKHIMYSDIQSVSNPFSFTTLLGQGGATGFGWKDVTTIKFGAEYNVNELLTVRGGYSYNTSPLRSSQLLLNILAPATSQHHITGGASYKFNENSQLDFAVMFSPNTTKRGVSPTGVQALSVKMHQLEVTAGYSYIW